MNPLGMCRASTQEDLCHWACRSPIGQNLPMTGRRGAIALLGPALLLGLMVAPVTGTASAEETTPAASPLPLEGPTDQLIVTSSSSVTATALEAAAEHASSNGGPYRIKHSTDGTRVQLSLSKRTATIAVRVLAIDSYGRGPWSEPAQTRITKRR